MGLEDKYISGSILRKIRKDLGLKQKDLKCEGIKNISRIENGETEISYTIANRLCNKINLIIKEKHIILDYDVTVDLLMGRTSILKDDLLHNLKFHKNENTIFEEINQVILNLKSDEAIELMLNVLEILNEDIYNCNEKICDYCYRLLNYNLSNYIRIDIFNYLIKSHFIQNQYIAVISIGKSFIYEVSKNATHSQKEKFFGNIANAYFQLKEYAECEKMLKLISQFTSKETELYFLLLKAVCKSQVNNIFGAIKVYESIIIKAMKIDNFDYIANSYSNIGDLYLKSDINIARENINKAIELIGNCTNSKFMLNCYYNKFLLSLEEKESEHIDESFEKSMVLATELNDSVLKNKLVSNILKFYIENNYSCKIPDFIKNIKSKYEYNIQDSTLLACIKHVDDEKIVYKSIKIAQNQ